MCFTSCICDGAVLCLWWRVWNHDLFLRFSAYEVVAKEEVETNGGTSGGGASTPIKVCKTNEVELGALFEEKTQWWSIFEIPNDA